MTKEQTVTSNTQAISEQQADDTVAAQTEEQAVATKPHS